MYFSFAFDESSWLYKEDLLLTDVVDPPPDPVPEPLTATELNSETTFPAAPDDDVHDDVIAIPCPTLTVLIDELSEQPWELDLSEFSDAEQKFNWRSKSFRN